MANGDLDRLSRKLKQLYDDYRSARLSVKYYSARLVTFQRLNFWMEILLAVTSSSAIGAWTLLHSGPGQSVWAALGGVTAVVAVLKPILQFPKRIERYQSLYGGYTSLFYDLESVVQEVKIEHALSEELEAVWASAKKRLVELAPQDDPPAELKGEWVRRFTDDVNCEIPVESLWIPEEDAA